MLETGRKIPPPPPAPKKSEDEVTVVLIKDKHGYLRCAEHRTTGFIPKKMAPKVIIYSELEAWKAAATMTKKEMDNGTHNPNYPMGPIKCNAGFPHWHLGHSPENIGRKPPRLIKLQLLMEKVDKILTKLQERLGR